MRLIDADKELKKLSEMVVEGETFITAVEFAKLILRNAPTVSTAEAMPKDFVENNSMIAERAILSSLMKKTAERKE
jgi:hypothetical protein